MRKSTALIALMCAIAMLIAGCGKNAATGVKTNATPNGTLPIVTEPLEITVWCPLWSNVAIKYTSMADTPLYKELEKRTNIKPKFIHPAAGQDVEQFGLMLASDELPDVIEYTWGNPLNSSSFGYAGGPDKAISDKVIIPLNDLMKEYAPNLTKIFAEHPDWDKICKTDSGNYFSFPFLRGDPILQTFQGPILRGDWLSDLGLSMPETMEEWRLTLTEFKNKKGATAPLRITMRNIIDTGVFSGAYGVVPDFFVNNGKILYGPVTPEYKEFLTEFAKWYKEGLIDQSFVANQSDSKILDALITTEKSGAMIGGAGGAIGKFNTLMQPNKPKFQMVGVKYPSLNKGEESAFGQMSPAFDLNGGSHFAVTTANKHTAETVRWLDYNYSEAGHMLFNFGLEGTTYEMKNGEPTYTDFVTKNPDMAMTDVLSMYTRASYLGPFVQDKRYIEQYYSTDEQKNAMKEWLTAKHDKIMPQVSMSEDESKQMASKMTEINIYVSEMFSKFVMGIESLDKYDAYVDKLKALGTDDVIKAQQSAYDRFLKR